MSRNITIKERTETNANIIEIGRRSLCKSELKLVFKINVKKSKVDEASSSISLKKKENGSLTIEAALVLPLFLWFVIMLFYFFLLIDVQGDVTMAMSKVAKELGQYQFRQEEYLECFSDQYITQYVKKEVGEKRLNKSCIKNGEKGFICRLKSESANKVDMVVKYNLKIPVPIFDLFEYPIIQKTLVHGWTGFHKEEGDVTQETMVYIAEGGTVYHQHRSCTYLELSIKSVEIRRIKKLRNRGGERYRPCEKCVKNSVSNITYITDWGNRYHTSLGCSGLKRSVRAIPISQIGRRGPCSKCW